MAELPDRKRMRLPDYDYSLGSPYFVTLSTHNRQRLFGAVLEGEMKLSPAGRMIAATWRELPEILSDLVLDEFIVMPDHFHAIFGFARASAYSTSGKNPTTVPRLIQCFKSLTVHHYSCGVDEHGWPRYKDRIWQRNYWDRVIRNDREIETYREYVYYNALRQYIEHQS